MDASIVSDMQDRGAIADASTTITSILDIKDGFNAEEIRLWGMGDACGNTPNNPYREENLMNAEFVSAERSLDQFHAYGEEKARSLVSPKKLMLNKPKKHLHSKDTSPKSAVLPKKMLKSHRHCYLLRLPPKLRSRNPHRHVW